MATSTSVSASDLHSIDQQILQIQSQIQALETDRRLFVRKSKGVSKLREQLDALLMAHDLSEREYLTIIADRIVSFVRESEPKQGEAAPRYWTDLAEYFARASVKRQKPGKAGRKATGDEIEAKPLVLKAGRYLNPHTGRYLQKIKRPTREFQEWIDEHGAETVAGWKVD